MVSWKTVVALAWHPRLTFLFSRRPDAALILGATLVVGCEAQGHAEGPRAQSVAHASSADRGRYLVEGLLQCFYCHSERDWDRPGGPITGHPGVGRIYEVDGDSRLVAPNITPDEETGIGLRTDDELERAIRGGISHTGRALDWAMPWDDFRRLDDADLAAVIAYLRSRESVHNPLPPTSLSPEWQAELDQRPPTTLVPLDLTHPDPVERGRGLVALGRCQGCHSAWDAPRFAGYFAGGNWAERGQAPAEDADGAWTANITPHASGLSYPAEAFIRFMRTGKDETIHGAMPWVVFRNLDDQDLEAIHAFLQTMHPVAHYVSSVDPPTPCPVCLESHGLGELNRPYEAPEGLSLGAPELETYVGEYYSSEWDWTLRLASAGDRLVARVALGTVISDDDPPAGVVVLSRTRLLIPGEDVVVDVEFDNGGNAARLTSVDADRDLLVRVE